MCVCACVSLSLCVSVCLSHVPVSVFPVLLFLAVMLSNESY
jgi:hypothetical protein